MSLSPAQYRPAAHYNDTLFPDMVVEFREQPVCDVQSYAPQPKSYKRMTWLILSVSAVCFFG